jgi:uncharacterized lipoprotein YmbA
MIQAKIQTKTYPRLAGGFLRARHLVLICAFFCGVAGCGAGPPPAKYVLGSVPSGVVTTRAETGLPVVELKRVQVPDYLDTSDLLERKGNELVPSASGLWGERLSVGMSRDLAASLASRLSRFAVTSTPPLDTPAQQVFVDVMSFEPDAAHQVLLVARWSVVNGVSGQVLEIKQTSLVEPIAGTGDAAVVAAMSSIVEKLADQIAAAVQSTSQGPG